MLTGRMVALSPSRTTIAFVCLWGIQRTSQCSRCVYVRDKWSRMLWSFFWFRLKCLAVLQLTHFFNFSENWLQRSKLLRVNTMRSFFSFLFFIRWHNSITLKKKKRFCVILYTFLPILSWNRRCISAGYCWNLDKSLLHVLPEWLVGWVGQ